MFLAIMNAILESSWGNRESASQFTFAKAYATVLMLWLDLAGKNDNIGPCLGKTSLSSLTFRGAGAFFTALVFSSTGWRPTALVFTPR